MTALKDLTRSFEDGIVGSLNEFEAETIVRNICQEYKLKEGKELRTLVEKALLKVFKQEIASFLDWCEGK